MTHLLESQAVERRAPAEVQQPLPFDGGFREVDGIDRSDECPLGNRALQPSLTTAEDKDAEVAAVEIAMRPGR